MNELTGTVDVRVGGRNQVRTNSILTFAKKAVVGWIAVLGLLAQSSRVEADRDVLLTYLSARKTLRLPRRLRRGGMSDLGSGLDARYPDRSDEVTVAYGSPTYPSCGLRYPVPLGVVAQVSTRRLAGRNPTAGTGPLYRYRRAI